MLPTSSPPARGSSPLCVTQETDRDVVPARAGIFWSDGRADTSRNGRPRPRGDLPKKAATPATPTASSPPARGSSSAGKGRRSGAAVVPARAGIFPRGI
ncbi:hypothetical protein FRAAL0448 [Frankia alni ACN14a]|uniref:Uncharacterized protein n=1 Tax=Frankia alni (strain DSM 45986 / CECT 9034 / ACN14a) TaxID=326424 RepID=Q0RTH5_FRAAA|nr:hypothetical protein FRAAL0448 [Frankia alni ACN14a]